MAEINRRRVLKGLSVGAGAMIAGCGSSNNGGGDGGDGGSTSSGGGGNNGGGSTTSSGGDGGGGSQNLRTIVWDEVAPPDGLDPHANDPTNTNNVFMFPENGYEPLIYPDPKSGKLAPLLASKVPTTDNGLVSNGGQTLKFPLRDGVTFHTGGTMTAADVKYSFERVQTMGLSNGAKELKDNIDSIETPDDSTVVMHLSNKETPVIMNSILTQAFATVVSKDAVESHGGVKAGTPNQWMAQNSAGTGPFKIGEMQPNYMVWAPHTDYWGETGIDQVRQKFVGDISTRISELQAGKVDGIHSNPDVYDQISKLNGVKVLTGPQMNPSGLFFNFEIPYDSAPLQQWASDDTVGPHFFHSKDIRKAFNYAMDYDTWLKNVMNDLAAQIPYVHIPGTLGYDENAPTYNYDPKKAEEHFKAAGVWEEGFTITLYNEQLTEFDKGNLFVKDHIEKLNDRFHINSVTQPEAKGVKQETADPFGAPMMFWGLLPIGTDPTPYYRHFYSAKGALGGRTKVETVIDPQIPKLIDQSATTTNQQDRIQIFHQLQKLCYEDPAVGFLYAPQTMRSVRSCVDGVTNPAWSHPHYKYYSVDNC